MNYSIDELVAAFECKTPGRLFRATFVPAGEKSTVNNWNDRIFTAPNKKEAVKIAREYGQQVIDMDMIYVYLANRGW